MRLTQDAQVMPSMGRESRRAGRSRSSARSYSMGVYHRGRAADQTTHTGGMPLEVVTATVAGPWGPVHVAATERGVVAVEWLEGAPM